MSLYDSSPPALDHHESAPSSRPVFRVVHTPQHGSGPTLRKCTSVSRDPRSVSERFRDARMLLGWTQEETARKYNVTRRTVIGWEKGRVMPADALVDIEAEAMFSSAREAM